MLLRVVTVTIASGQHDAYWAWAGDIVSLWDAAGVVRAGGPYATTGGNGEDLAVWLTVHPGEEEMRTEFRTLYAEGRGRELIEQRPALVESTLVGVYEDWAPERGAAKGLPALIP